MSEEILALKSAANARPLQASKWVTLSFLLDEAELEQLLDLLKPYFLFRAQGVFHPGEGELKWEEVKSSYCNYLKAIQNKQWDLSDQALFTRQITAFLTADKESLYLLKIDEERRLIKAQRPVICLQPHRMEYSFADHQIRAQVYGKEFISWGLQLSYPALYEDERGKIHSTFLEPGANTRLFQTIQRWLRNVSLPTPFISAKGRVVASARLGKKCLNWIDAHPHLLNKGLRVENRFSI